MLECCNGSRAKSGVIQMERQEWDMNSIQESLLLLLLLYIYVKRIERACDPEMRYIRTNYYY